jgi:hypothetical protein
VNSEISAVKAHEIAHETKSLDSKQSTVDAVIYEVLEIFTSLMYFTAQKLPSITKRN